MSFCTPRPMPTEPVTNISSEMIWLNRKSLTPRPPYFSSNSQPISPCSPAASHASRLTLPSRSHFSTFGTHSRSKKLAGGGPELVVDLVEDVAAHGLSSYSAQVDDGGQRAAGSLQISKSRSASSASS